MTEYQNNRANTTNKEVQYIFAQWDVFTAKLTQIYRDLEAKATAEQKIQALTQQTSAIEYTIQFQTYITQIQQNKSTLMSQYQNGLKLKI